MKKAQALLYTLGIIAVLFIFCWSGFVLIITRQTDLLLILCILLATILAWCVWYSFLTRKKIFCISCAIILIITLFLGYLAFMDVVAPV